MVQEMVADFATNELEPIAHEIDEHHRFPKDKWEMIVELGLPGIPFPEDVGGSDGGTLAYIIAVEEIAKVCGSTALGFAAHVSLGTYPIWKWGGKSLREAYVPKLIAGEYMGAYGLTEPGAGSDSGGTSDDGGARRRRVRPQRPQVLHHEREPRGRVHLPRPSPTNRSARRGSRAFVVPRDIAGFLARAGRGQARHARLRLGEPRLPGRAHSARPPARPRGRGLLDVHEDARGRPHLDRCTCRSASPQGAFELRDEATRPSGEAFGGTLSDQQAVQFKLADMRVQIEAARHLVYHAARLKDAGQWPYGTEASIAKLHASETAMKCHLRGDPDLRRLRLQPGVPGRADVARRQALHDRRGHERDPAPDHRTRRSCKCRSRPSDPEIHDGRRRHRRLLPTWTPAAHPGRPAGRITSLMDAWFRLDGGAMWGVVPKNLWARMTPPAEDNSILLAARPFLAEK